MQRITSENAQKLLHRNVTIWRMTLHLGYTSEPAKWHSNPSKLQMLQTGRQKKNHTAKKCVKIDGIACAPGATAPIN